MGQLLPLAGAGVVLGGHMGSEFLDSGPGTSMAFWSLSLEKPACTGKGRLSSRDRKWRVGPWLHPAQAADPLDSLLCEELLGFPMYLRIGFRLLSSKASLSFLELLLC